MTTPATPASAAEHALLASLRDMLARPEYLLPLVFAQRQFRDRYYGLSSAALLEDLFHDALANYIRRFRPMVTFERPKRGQKGWDYKFEDLEISHKVGLKPQDIAVLWDATKRLKIWNAKYPIAFLCAAYQPVKGTMEFAGVEIPIKALTGSEDEVLKRNHALWLVHTSAAGRASVLWTTSTRGGNLSALAPFAETWPVVADAMSRGAAANEIDMFRATRAKQARETWPSVGDAVQLNFDQLPGISLMRTADLQNVPVDSNNRAILIRAATVREKMDKARADGYFVPMPLWFRIYAGSRPPDLFLIQRTEFDAMFSPTQP